jgi:hypothetical protein
MSIFRPPVICPNCNGKINAEGSPLAGRTTGKVCQHCGAELEGGVTWDGLAKLAEKPEPVRAASSASTASELEKLAALRDSGALTEEEFAAAKKRILGT